MLGLLGLDTTQMEVLGHEREFGCMERAFSLLCEESLQAAEVPRGENDDLVQQSRQAGHQSLFPLCSLLRTAFAGPALPPSAPQRSSFAFRSLLSHFTEHTCIPIANLRKNRITELDSPRSVIKAYCGPFPASSNAALLLSNDADLFLPSSVGSPAAAKTGDAVPSTEEGSGRGPLAPRRPSRRDRDPEPGLDDVEAGDVGCAIVGTAGGDAGCAIGREGDCAVGVLTEGEGERGRGTVGRGGEGRGSLNVGMAGTAGTGGGLVAIW